MRAGVEVEAETVFAGSRVREDQSDTAGGAEVGKNAGACGDADKRGRGGRGPVALEGEL